MSDSDPWKAILERIEDGASLIGLDPDTLSMLSLPERVLEVAVPIRRDNGKIEVFRGWRCAPQQCPWPRQGRDPFSPVRECPRDHGTGC